MNKWIVLATTALLLLAVRAVYKHIQGVRSEKVWYINQLNYQFSAHVDSVAIFPTDNRGLVYLHLTGGDVESSTEAAVNRKLKYNDRLRFIHHIDDHKLWFFTGEINKYNSGDSIHVNTDENKIMVYRNGGFFTESEIAAQLIGRPF